MKPIVKLTVINGDMEGQEYTFSEPKECLVGRSQDCDIKVPDTYDNLDVSRHHCLFQIDPPSVLVCDLISKNGTFVNNTEIATSPDDEVVELHDEDKVRLGHLVMQVHIVEQETNDMMVPAFSG